MKEKTVTLNGTAFTLERMNAFEQADLFNRVLPALTPLLGGIFAYQAGKNEALAVSAEKVLQIIPAKEREDILFNVLLKTVRLNGMPLVSKTETGARCFVKDDLDLFDILTLAGEVVEFNFSRFFEAASLGRNTTSPQTA